MVKRRSANATKKSDDPSVETNVDRLLNSENVSRGRSARGNVSEIREACSVRFTEKRVILKIILKMHNLSRAMRVSSAKHVISAPRVISVHT